MRLAVAIAGGMVGAASGAGCMTVLRMLARRAGWIDLMPPQATGEWLTEQAGVETDHPAAQHILDAVVHWAIGVGAGAVYGALVQEPTRARVPDGALFGLGVWTVAFGALLPALGITRPVWRSTARETAVNVASHLAYGAATALVTSELGRQSRVPEGPLRRLRARVG
jgi:uncharacterized membrane protein YagU involved in acid resistance